MLKTINKLTVAYNNSLRMLLGIPKYYSASEMFAYTNLASRQCVTRNIYNVMKCMENMTNYINNHSIVKSDMMYSSLCGKKWINQLYCLH